MELTGLQVVEKNLSPKNTENFVFWYKIKNKSKNMKLSFYADSSDSFNNIEIRIRQNGIVIPLSRREDQGLRNGSIIIVGPGETHFDKVVVSATRFDATKTLFCYVDTNILLDASVGTDFEHKVSWNFQSSFAGDLRKAP